MPSIPCKAGTPGKNPRLHASLRLVLDPRTERHRRWAFRAIAAGHPRAVQSRLRKAAEASGLDAGRTDRHLFVLRNTPWPTGKVTEQETESFTAKGGIVLPVSPEDLTTFAALGALTAEHHPALNAWLADRVYSSVPAQEFGLEQKIEISPVSGLSNVKYWLETHGYDAEDEAQCRVLFEAAKRTDRVLSDDECHRLLKQAVWR